MNNHYPSECHLSKTGVELVANMNFIQRVATLANHSSLLDKIQLHLTTALTP
jgi:hypothetical protein